MQHSQVVLGFLGPSDEQVAEAVEPGMGALHHLAPGFLASLPGLGLLAARPDVGRVAERGHHGAYLLVVVARVEAQAGRCTRRLLGLSGRFSGRRQAA